MIKSLLIDFPDQLQKAIQIGKAIKLKKNKKIRNIVACGLGGSGIGANVVAEYIADKCDIPMMVYKDYDLPKYVNKHTLVIISSYSGNTEETIHMMKQALHNKAVVVSISSGGQTAELAKKKKIPYVLVPGGMPPRSCMGYSIVQQLYILKKIGLISKKFESDIDQAIVLLREQQQSIIEQSMKIAKKLHGKLPIIYIQSRMESVAIRLRQNINENSKTLCRHHVIPEMNHNELVGRGGGSDMYAPLFLRNENDPERIQYRIKLNQDVIQTKTKTICEIYSKGDSFLVQALYLIHFGDWISIHLAELNKVDPMEIKVIDNLKNALSTKK